jgi:spore coat protein CotH
MNNCPDKTSSETLASMIVAYRSLGLFKDQAKKAMIELAKRRDEGDDFDFESFIEAKLNEVPKSDFNSDVSKFLRSLSFIGNSR